MISHSESFESDQDSYVKVRVDGASGTILLNRPEQKNALTRGMLEQVQQALSDLHQEKKVRAVILTGAGDAFSSGSDLKEIQRTMKEEEPQSIWFADCMAQKALVEAMLRFPKPIIAAVNGPALGLGAALVLSSDIVIGTESATFGFPEPQRGLVAGIGAPLIAYRLGAAAAADFLLRAELIDGKKCREMGIFRCLVDVDLAWAKADAIARDLLTKDATSVSMTKRLLNETVGEALFTQLSSGAAATASARTTEAAEEGINAFAEKREPEWP